MAEGNTHKRLKVVALAYLKKTCCDMVAEEVKFRNLKSVADTCGINFARKEIRIIEVKASLKDYMRDSKLFDVKTSYYPHSNFFYIMCPTNVIPKEKVCKEFGLIYVDENNNVTIIQKPTKNKKTRTKFETALKNTSRSVINNYLYNVVQIQKQVPWIKDFDKTRH